MFTKNKETKLNSLFFFFFFFPLEETGEKENDLFLSKSEDISHEWGLEDVNLQLEQQSEDTEE